MTRIAFVAIFSLFTTIALADETPIAQPVEAEQLTETEYQECLDAATTVSRVNRGQEQVEVSAADILWLQDHRCANWLSSSTKGHFKAHEEAENAMIDLLERPPEVSQLVDLRDLTNG